MGEVKNLKVAVGDRSLVLLDPLTMPFTNCDQYPVFWRRVQTTIPTSDHVTHELKIDDQRLSRAVALKTPTMFPFPAE